MARPNDESSALSAEDYRDFQVTRREVGFETVRPIGSHAEPGRYSPIRGNGARPHLGRAVMGVASVCLPASCRRGAHKGVYLIVPPSRSSMPAHRATDNAIRLVQCRERVGVFWDVEVILPSVARLFTDGL